MTALSSLGSTPVVHAVGLALIHFSWQGLLLGSLLSLTLIALRDRSPNARYAVSLATMLLMLAAPIVTTYVILLGGSGTLSGATESVLLLRDRSLATGWIVPLLPWFTGFWVLGTSFLQVRLIMDWLRAQRLQRVGNRLLPDSWQRDLDQLRLRLKIRHAVRIFESTLVDVPSVIGLARPIVLVPVGILSIVTPHQLRAVIAHELAHIRRHDTIVNLLQNVFESVLFFHPVTWWVSDRLRAEREYCCDDVAVSVCGSPLHYAQALSSLEEFRGRESQGALASTGGDLMQRISRIFDSKTGTSTPRASWLPPLISLVGVIAMAAVIATGCNSDGESGSSVADRIVGPAAAAESSGTLSEGRLMAAAARLEECRVAGLLTDEQVEFCLQRLSDSPGQPVALYATGGEDGEQCVVVCAPGGANTSCCPGGEKVYRLQPDESLKDCLNRQFDRQVDADEATAAPPRGATPLTWVTEAETGAALAAANVE